MNLSRSWLNGEPQTKQKKMSQSEGAVSTKTKLDPNGKYYELLGIDNWQEATKDSIQKSFRRKAAEYHPDRVSDETKKKEYEDIFAKITEANTILKDPELKAKYDLILKQEEAKERQKNEMDAKTRQLRESLEEREKQAQQNKLKKQSQDQVLFNKQMASQLKESGAYDALHKVQEKRREREQQKSLLEDDDCSQVIVKWKKTQTISEEDLKILFSRLFGVVDVMIFKESKRRCVISFEKSSSAKKAAQYDWSQLSQYKFKVKLASDNSKKRDFGTTTETTNNELNEEQQQHDLNLRLLRMASKKQKI